MSNQKTVIENGARRIVENIFFIGSLMLFMMVIVFLFEIWAPLGFLGFAGLLVRLAVRTEHKAKQVLKDEHIL